MKRFDCTQLTNYIELATIKNNIDYDDDLFRI